MFLPLLLGAALLGCQQVSQPEITRTPYTPDSGSVAVRCGVLIDGLADNVIEDRLVVIHHGRVAAVVAGDSEVPLGMPFLDLGKSTCLPGLINTHVHLLERGSDSNDYDYYYRSTQDQFNQRVLEAAEDALLSGFTTVRNPGDYVPAAITFARDDIRAGRALGPRIRTGGPFLTIESGGGDLVIPDHDPDDIPPSARLGVASGPDEFREKALNAIDAGADFLKVIASGAVFSYGPDPGLPEMTYEEIAAVADVAREAGLKVTAHVHSAQSGRDAIRAGVDSIEHASLLTDEVLALVEEHGIALSMDVYNGTYTDTVGRQMDWPEHILQRNTDTTEAQRVVFEKAYKLGITIMYGTDASIHPHDMGAWQFKIMVERGMAPMDAIKSATSVPADHMEIADDVGAIEAGRYGDLIAVSGNPLEDMMVMRDADVVIKGGLVFKYDKANEAN